MSSKVLPSDRLLAGLVWALTLFGVVMVFDASYAHALAFYGKSWQFGWMQAISAGLGLGAMAFFARFDYRRLMPVAPVVYGVGIVMLLAVASFGQGANGGQRWLRILGLQFQPSEFVKLGLILGLAAALVRIPETRVRTRSFWALFAFAMLPIGLTERQPDLGTAVTMFLAVAAMAVVAGVRGRLLGLAATLCAVVVALVVFLPKGGSSKHGGSESYRVRRVLSFVDPGSQRDGAGLQNWHSLVALGNGGVGGVGFTNSLEKRVGGVPMQRTDFIFAIIGEEFGLIGTVTVLAMFLGIGFRGYGIACRCREPFGQLLAVGITTLVCGQAALNVAVVTSSIPNTGIPLPLISYGGSALIPTLAGFGILLNISRLPYGRRLREDSNADVPESEVAR